MKPYIPSEESRRDGEGRSELEVLVQIRTGPFDGWEYGLLFERGEEEWNLMTSGGTRFPLVPGGLKLLETTAEFWLNILKMTVEYRLKLLIFIS